MTTVKSIKVKEVMSPKVKSVTVDHTMRHVAEMLAQYKIHHLPVIDNEGKVVGIISQKEIDLINAWGADKGMRMLAKQSEMLLDSLLASECASHNVRTVQEDDTLEDCAKLFFNNAFHAMPVMKDGKLVGMITTYDLLRKAYN